MSQLADPVLAAIAAGGAGGLPKATARQIFNIVRLLRASRRLDDVSLFRPVTPSGRGRQIVQVSGKWAISFNFIEGLGPNEMRLEKLGKSWPKKTKPHPRRKRLVKS